MPAFPKPSATETDPVASPLVEAEATARAAADSAHAALTTGAHGGIVASAEKGAANGVATLGADGKILDAQLGQLAITDVFTVASQAAMLALTAERGDVAIRSDLNKSFILSASPASTLANWKELLAPTDVVTTVNGRQGAVTGLAEQSALDSAVQLVEGTADDLAAEVTARIAGDRYRGDWAGSTAYKAGDVFNHSGTLYYVAADMTSASTFNFQSYTRISPGALEAVNIATINTHSWGGYLADMLARGLRAVKKGSVVGGAPLLVHGASAGGWCHIMKNMPYTSLVAPVGTPRQQLGVLIHGLNDCTATSQAQFASYFAMAVRAIVCCYRSTARFPTSDSSWSAESGTWSQGNQGAYTTTGTSTYRQTSTSGDTKTISVPSTYTGGDIWVQGPLFSTGGALITFTVDGNAAGTIDTRSSALGTYPTAGSTSGVPWIKRLGSFAPGAHTIVCTVTTVQSGAVAFDTWGYEATVAPLVVLVKAPLEPRTAPDSNTKIGYLNAAFATVAAEFSDGNVAALDTSVLDASTTYFNADDRHLTIPGYVVLMKLIMDYVATRTDRMDAMRQVATEPQT